MTMDFTQAIAVKLHSALPCACCTADQQGQAKVVPSCRPSECGISVGCERGTGSAGRDSPDSMLPVLVSARSL